MKFIIELFRAGRLFLKKWNMQKVTIYQNDARGSCAVLECHSNFNIEHETVFVVRFMFALDNIITGLMIIIIIIRLIGGGFRATTSVACSRLTILLVLVIGCLAFAVATFSWLIVVTILAFAFILLRLALSNNC